MLNRAGLATGNPLRSIELTHWVHTYRSVYPSTAACTCSEDCQQCFDDVYNQCGGCSQSYDWDTDRAPAIKTQAESMGCGGAAQVTPLFAALAAVANHFLN